MTPRIMKFHPVLQASAVPSTDHSHCWRATARAGQGQSRADFEDGAGIFSFVWHPSGNADTGCSVDFLWNWDKSLKTLEGARAGRICSLECPVSSTTTHTSGTQRAGNCVSPLTTTNWTIPLFFFLTLWPLEAFWGFFSFLFLIFFPLLLEM